MNLKSIPTPCPVESLWFPLVKKFYQAHYPSGKPNKSDPLWSIKDGATILAAVRIKPFHDCQLMTALVTHPEYRRKGCAGLLLDAITPILKTRASYCLNQPELIPFYTQHGFQVVANEVYLPSDIQGRLNKYRVKQPSLVVMTFQAP